MISSTFTAWENALRTLGSSKGGFVVSTSIRMTLEPLVAVIVLNFESDFTCLPVSGVGFMSIWMSPVCKAEKRVWFSGMTLNVSFSIDGGPGFLMYGRTFT